MTEPVASTAEFIRLVDVAHLPPQETVRDIAAAPGERAALARRFGLLALDRLEARVRLARLAGNYLRLSATLSAEVVQACVVTLEPVPARIEDEFTVLYGPTGAERREVVLSGTAELVEPPPRGVLDIGEVVAQQLSLALDPYPRAPGAAVPSPGDALGSPFAGLAKWRERG